MDAPFRKLPVVILASLHFAAVVSLLDLQTYPASLARFLGLMLLFTGSVGASALAWGCVERFFPKRKSRDLYTEALVEIETENSAAGKSK